MATDLGADILTNERTDDLADAATYPSPCAGTVSSTNRATLKDADDAALTTTQFYAIERTHFRAVVTTFASADDATVTSSLRIAFTYPETDVLRRKSAAFHGAHHAAFCRTHGPTVGRTDSQKNRAADHRTDGLYER